MPAAEEEKKVAYLYDLVFELLEAVILRGWCEWLVSLGWLHVRLECVSGSCSLTSHLPLQTLSCMGYGIVLLELQQ